MNQKGQVGSIVIGLISIILFVTLFVLSIVRATHKDTTVDTVIRSERVVDSTGHSARYLIFGQHETLEDVDSYWYWKFNSSDIYGAIQPNHTYQFIVTGWRVPFLSWYRNIISYKLIK